MESSKGIKNVLFGIEVTLLGGVLILVGTGSAGTVGLLIAIGGFPISVTGFVATSDVPKP